MTLMGKSSGARPRKAVRAEVLALKAELSECHYDNWVRAQGIFDRICELCEVKGPSDMKMTPRACRYCRYFGHTRQFCPLRSQEAAEVTQEAAPPAEPETELEMQWRLWCELAARTYKDMSAEDCWTGNGRWRAEFDRRCPPWDEAPWVTPRPAGWGWQPF